MPEIPLSGFLLEALGAAILAVILWSFARGRPRPGVRDWALGLCALAGGLVSSIAVRRVSGPAAQNLVLAVAVVLAYWSAALLILGTWSHATGREVPLFRRRLLVALGAIGVATTLAAPHAGPWGPMLRSGTRTLATMAAQLAAGVALLRRPSGRGLGALLVGVAFLGGAAEEAVFFAIVAGGGASPRAVPAPDMLVEVELVLLMLLGVGLVAWLLEDELESGLRLQEALHRREAFAAMGTLVGGVAHEVRNPLFAISATLDAFVARCGGIDAPGGPLLATLRAQVGRLSALMADLLEYGRPIAPERVRRPLAALAARAVESCAAHTSRVNVAVELSGDPAGPPVLMDEGRLLQVFENLLRNALDHTPSGGRVRMRVGAEVRGGRRGAMFEVRDSGPGFEAADLPCVFEPFFSHRRGGTGLGLSIVRRVVEQHSGQVDASNDPAGGAVVRVWLPLEHEASRPGVPLTLAG
jgi:signal transduction histidine kinase